jgi:hypothetical protein
MSILLKTIKNKKSINSEFTSKNIDLILIDIKKNNDEYKTIDKKTTEILQFLLQYIVNNDYNIKYKKIFSIIILYLNQYNDIKYKDKFLELLKKSTDTKNYLTEDDIKILYNPIVIKTELIQLLHKNNNNNYITNEIRKKIDELDKKDNIEKELNAELNAELIINKTDMLKYQNITNFDFSNEKIILVIDTFEKFSILNYGIYPKLISLMLDPKKFCDMWYGNTEITEQKPYILINKILDTLFILSYKNGTKDGTKDDTNTTSFTYKNKYIFKRDTLICKSLQIQNLISFRNSLPSPSDIDINIMIKYKIKLNIINKKIDKIKSDINKYIFNYKLLNELQNYYSINKDILERNKSKKKDTDDYKNVLEFYYYNDQINKSLEKIEELNSIINDGCKKISDGKECKKINYNQIINDSYIDLMSSHAQVLTYVKERNDAHKYADKYPDLNNKMNPRYKIELMNNKNDDVYPSSNEKSVGDGSIKYYDFNISYFNEPDRIGFENKDDPYTKYNQEIAEKNVKNPNDKKWEHYKLGKINRYYGWNMTSEEISKDLECGLILLKKLRRFEDIIIVGNGQSGAGKTASLIGFMDGKTNKPGLLPNLANQLIKPEKESKDINNSIQYFNKATVKLINLYLNLDDNLNKIEDMELKHYYPYNIKLFNKNGIDYIDDKEFIFKTENNEWICENESRKENTLDEIISEAFEIREVEPTKNNPNSSRSHIIVCVTFTGSTMVNNKLADKEAKIVICDFAGVEDKFTCELLELMMLDKNYYEKSDKYRIVNDNKVEISESDRKEKNMRYINYDNYFCSNKYTKKENEEAQLKEFELFPKNKIIEKNNMINENIQYIDYFNNLSKFTDPIISSINQYMQKFNNEPINEIDKTSFNNNDVPKSLIDNYIDNEIRDFIYYDNPYDNPIYNSNYNSIILNITDTDANTPNNCNSKVECCNNVIVNKYTKIEDFMKDFTTLDTKFYDDYKKINNVGKIKEEIKKKIKELIDIQFDININLDDFKYNLTDLTDEINKQIIELKKKNDTNNGEIVDQYIMEISDNEDSTNYKKAHIQLEYDKDKEKNDLLEKKNMSLTNIKTDANTEIKNTEIKNTKIEKRKTINTEMNNITIDSNEIINIDINNIIDIINMVDTKIKKNDTEIIKYQQYTDEIINANNKISYKASNKELYNIVLDNVKLKGGTETTNRKFTLKSYDPITLNITFTSNSVNFTNVIKYLNEIYLKIKTENDELTYKIEPFKTIYNKLQKDISIIDQIYNNALYIINKKTITDIKKDLDSISLNKMEQKKIEEKKRYENEMNNYINTIIKKNYYNKLIEYKKKYIEKKIKDKFEERKKDYEKIKLLIQQLIRLSQLEFNCSIRRKEGYMINTSLKEMQKFIGSILFESTKKRYNKLLIENNLLVLDKKYYRDSDYIEHNNKISSSLNSIKNDMKVIKYNNIDDNIENVKDRIIQNVKDVKKQVLKYFTYILSTINDDNNKLYYTDNIHLQRLLIYICFIDAINSIIINDYINFNIIFYLLSIMGDGNYTRHFEKMMDSIKGETLINLDLNDSTDILIKSFFYYENEINILKLVFDYSKKTTKNEKLIYIFDIIKQFDFYTKHQYNDGVKVHDSKIVMDNSNKQLDNITNINYSDIKFNTADNVFKEFVTDYTTICTLLYSDAEIQLEKSKENLSKALKESSESHMTPILYSPPSTDICTENKYKYENEYEKFYYNQEKNKDNPKNNLEMLFNIMKTPSNNEIVGKKGSDIYKFGINGFGLNMEKSTLVIFTVINVTPNPYAPTNNPPIPPFININKLKLIHKIVNIEKINTVQNKLIKLKENINKICETYLEKLKTYKFYESLEVEQILDANKIFNDKGKLLKEKIIDLIDSNNATTLIGTVDFEKFTKIRDPEETYFICDDKSDSVLLKLENIENISQQLDEAIKELDNEATVIGIEAEVVTDLVSKAESKEASLVQSKPDYINDYKHNNEKFYNNIKNTLKKKYKDTPLDEKKQKCKDFVKKVLKDLSTDELTSAQKKCDTEIK